MPDVPFLLERTPHLAFVDVDRTAWSIFDCVGVRDQLVIVSAGSATAAFRVFEGMDGERLVYAFAEAEERTYEPSTLSRQRHAARPLADSRRS